MKLMTADAIVKISKKYSVDIYVKDGSLQCNLSSLSTATPALKHLLRLHREVLRNHFGV